MDKTLAAETPDLSNAGVQEATSALSPELVREIADKVYRLWLAELRIENERLGAQRTWLERGAR